MYFGKISLKFTVFSTALIINMNLFANEDSRSRGEKLASTRCVACHGKKGISNMANYPNLAGQRKEYIDYALKLYRTKQRKGGVANLMYAMAANLSDQEIQDLSLYFSTLK